MAKEHPDQERVDNVTEYADAHIKIFQHLEYSKGKIHELQPASRHIKPPFKQSTVEIFKEWVRDEVLFVREDASVELLVACTTEEYQKERSRVITEGGMVMDEADLYLSIASHFFDWEVRDQRKKRPTHIVAEEIEAMFQRSTQLRDNARSFIGQGCFFLEGLLGSNEAPRS